MNIKIIQKIIHIRPFKKYFNSNFLIQERFPSWSEIHFEIFFLYKALDPKVYFFLKYPMSA